MIKQTDAWHLIIPGVRPVTLHKPDGMHIFFGDRDKVLGAMTSLVDLVDDYKLTAACVNTMSARSLSPLRKSVLYVATSNVVDRDKTLQILQQELGIEPQLWKSMPELIADAQPGGWLGLGGRIVRLGMLLQQDFAVNRTALEKELKFSSYKLQRLFDTADGDRAAEMKLADMESFLREQRELALAPSDTPTAQGELTPQEDLLEHLNPWPDSLLQPE